MIVQHNMTAFNANRQLGITNSNLAKSTEKLSSGYRVNRAADDAAGLSISEKMRGQIRGLNQASTNAQDGISLIQTAEGALNEIHSVLQRMRELTVQASNDTNVTADRKAIAKEVRALTSEITRIATQTEFNTMKLLSGRFRSGRYTYGEVIKGPDGRLITGVTPGTETPNNDRGKKLNLQVGANTGQLISLNIEIMTAGQLGVSATRVAQFIEKGEYNGNALTGLITIVNAAITKVSLQRSALGALQNRLDHTIANADNTAENLQSSESRIRDANMADEMVQYSSSSILQQAGQSMLAQANQATQGILSLLG